MFSEDYAKKHADGILKMQISITKDEDGQRSVLLYDEEYKRTNNASGFHALLPLGDEAEKAMGYNLKQYFYYRMKRRGLFGGTKLELLHQAPSQSW